MEKHHCTRFVVLSAIFLCFCAGVFWGRAMPSPAPKLTPAFLPLSDDPIVLNKANLQDLMTLPGIGQTLAHRILEYRQSIGAFTSVAQLLNIEGIGQARLEALLPYITTGGS